MSVADFDDGDPIGSATLAPLASNLAPPSTGEVLGASFGQAFSENPTVALTRIAARDQAAGQTASPLSSIGLPSLLDPNAPDARSGIAATPQEPSVPKDELNKTYGIPGVLSFDKDMPASIAADINAHHVAELQRQDILQRNVSSLATGGLARFGAAAAAGLLDPLNVAAAFVPGLPEARVAAFLGDDAMGAGGRAAVRAITGASQGVAGMAALQPLQYGIDKAQQDDWDMGTALSQIAFGGLLGGVLHPGLGMLEDAKGLPAWAKPIAGSAQDMQESLARGALAAVSEDRPITNDAALSLRDDLDAANNPLRPIEPAEASVAYPTPEGATPTETALVQHFSGYAEQLGASVTPNEALMLARQVTDALPENQDAMAQSALRSIAIRADPEAVRGVQSRAIDTAQNDAQQIADAQRPRPTPEDTAATNEITQRAARTPDPTGDPTKDLAAVQQHAADFQAYVQQETAAGRWGADDQAALDRINEQVANSEGDAKAYAAASACLGSNFANA